MTGGSARHGRRNNGLYAAEYAVVGDVDPRVGEHLLDVLGNRGIAAYLQPAADQHPITRLTTLPSRPTDRLYVDRTELGTARKYLDMVGGDAEQSAANEAAEATPADAPMTITTSAPLDVDSSATRTPTARSGTEFEEAWQSIVAGYHQPGTVSNAPPWPSSEDVAAPAAGTGPAVVPPTTAPPAPSPSAAIEWPRWSGPRREETSEPSLLDGLDTLGADLPDEEEEDYEPPPPPPLPRFSAMTVFAMVAIAVGFVLIVFPDLLPVATGGGPILGGALLIAGAVALIARLRSGNDDDPDDPDLGAVV